jgi:hypothetical protein
MTTSGYSGTPLWKKLGYRSGLAVYLRNAPANYRELLTLPREIVVTWAAKPGDGTHLVHHFTDSKAELRDALGRYRKSVVPDGSVWVSWPKKASGVKADVTEDAIRELALPLGFVDVKVCAVDEKWSGLKLVIRKTER